MKRILVILTLLLPLMAHAQANLKDSPKWLETATFYQIYPSTYMDSDGNGIGDLPGIISKLDYVKSLGVNAIWLNPIFESGWFDGGYDVIDFYKVDPRLGKNSDVVTLVNEAHKRGIKIILDLVAGHTSDKCAWFKESSSADGDLRYSDYYIWMDQIPEDELKLVKERQALPDRAYSTLGRYVETDAPRAKYYEKNYFECQPALNYGFANPDPNHPWEQPVDAPGPKAVRREMKNIMSFWFDKGVDGFRVDLAGRMVKNDPDQRETRKMWREMREWLNAEYPENVIIAEWSNPAESVPAGFHIDFMMHWGVKGYETLFFDPGTPRWREGYDESYFDLDGKGGVRKFTEAYAKLREATLDYGFVALPTANHDFQRMNILTRNTPEQLKVVMTFFLTMPGVPFIYYGDEIGMKYQMGLPSKEGSDSKRAGTRTPMQWENNETAGFSTCEPSQLYLPVCTDGGKITVEMQDKDPESMLNHVRGLIKMRSDYPALSNCGDWKVISNLDKPYPYVYSRSMGDQTCVVVLNPSAQKVTVDIPYLADKTLEPLVVTGKCKAKGSKITVGGVSSAVYLVK